MRCSKCGTKNPRSSSVRGLQFADLAWWLLFSALAILGAITVAAPDAWAREEPSLVQLAAANFPNLTRAERAMLEFAQAGNARAGEFAQAGPSANPADPSNDPAQSASWPAQRNIRAELVRWLLVDRNAITRVDPKGIRALGARILGNLDLSDVHAPCAIALVRCRLGEVNLQSAEIKSLDLSGSYATSVRAAYVVSHGSMFIGWDGTNRGGDFHCSGKVYMPGARVDGDLSFGGGRFQHPAVEAEYWEANKKVAIDASNSEVKGDLNVCCDFEAHGAVDVDNATIGKSLDAMGGRFVNPDNQAISALSLTAANVYLVPGSDYPSQDTQVNGVLDFTSAQVQSNFVVNRAKFSGKPAEQHGFEGGGLVARGGLVWTEVTLEPGAFLDLRGAQLGGIIDDEGSWPSPGKLLIDGLSYKGLVSRRPRDAAAGLNYNEIGEALPARSRLRWLALQPGFHQQPYQQLAKVLEESGDDSGAMQVLVAKEDLRYAHYGPLGRLWGGFLRYTVGYGHRPMLTIMWSMGFVLVGWLIVRGAKAAAVMRPTYPENALAAGDRRYEHLYPFLFSLDVFLPFVNLHQEHYWWPDADATGACRVLGRTLNLRGSVVLYYLWAQIIAGWILSAIFVAGMTGLIKGD